MRLTRVFVDQAITAGTGISLPEQAALHLTRVLKLKVGDGCIFFNGDGQDYCARLAAIDKRGARAEILSAREIDNESPFRLVLLQGIARGEKMDLILQKATELGVAAIVPIQADRTEVKLDAQRLRKRIAHWRKVVIAACEQCGRARIPSVTDVLTLDDPALETLTIGLRLILDPTSERTPNTLPSNGVASCTIAIGPEGGWSPRDRALLQSFGFAGLRLGPRVLRTETAGLAAIAALQTKFGDW